MLKIVAIVAVKSVSTEAPVVSVLSSISDHVVVVEAKQASGENVRVGKFTVFEV